MKSLYLISVLFKLGIRVILGVLILSLFFLFVLKSISHAQSPLPDLTIESITQGGGGKTTVVVKNIGDASYSSTPTSANYLNADLSYRKASSRNGASTGRKYNNPINLAPGQSLSWVLDYDSFFNTYDELEVKLDAGNRIAESDDSALSNNKKVTLKIPDFELLYPYFQGEPANRGLIPAMILRNLGSSSYDDGSLTIKWEWKNATGGVVSSGTANVSKDAFLPQNNNNFAIPSASPVPQGATSVVLTVDPGNSYEEFSESNNSVQLFVPADLAGDSVEGGMPDLIIESIRPGSNNDFIFTIKNIGNAPLITSNGFRLAYSFEFLGADGSMVGSGGEITVSNPTNGGLVPGQSVEVTRPLGNSNNLVAVVGTVDPNNLVQETKGNNTKRYEVPQPDLAAGAIVLNSDYSGTAEIKNISSTPVTLTNSSGYFYIEFISETGSVFTYKFTRSLSFARTLDANKSYLFNFGSGDVPQTAKKMRINIDSTVSEVTKSNNIGETIDIPGRLPDLIITSAKQVGNQIEITLKNIGVSKFEGTVFSRTNWDGNTAHVFPNSLGSITLEKDAEVVKQIPITVPTKTTTFQISVDTATWEDKKENNSTELTIMGSETLAELVEADEESISADIAAGIDGEATNDQSVTPTVTPGAEVTKTANITPKETKRKFIDPRKLAGVLPDSPFYIIEELGRGIDITLTFNDEKKAEKLKKIADEKILETNILIDNGNTSKAKDSLKGYKTTVNDLKKSIDKVRIKDAKKADDLSIVVIGAQLDHLPVLDNLQSKTEVDDSLMVKANRDETLKNIGDIAGKIKDGNKVGNIITRSTSDKKSAFKPLKDLVAINEISTHIADGKVRDALLDAKEKHQRHLNNNLQSMDDRQLAVFKEYMKKTTGDQVNTLKALDDVKVVAGDKKVRTALATVKQDTTASLVKDIKTAKSKKMKAGEEMLSDLKGGTITDLRVLADLKTAEKDVAADVTSVKKTAIGNFAKKTSSLSPGEKQKYLKEVTEDHLDLTQQAVANDFKRILPKDTTGKELDTTLKTEVKTKVAKVKQNKKQYDELVDEFASDTSTDATVMNEFASSFDRAFVKDMFAKQLSYMKSYYATADPETKKFFDQYYFNNPEIQAFYTDFDLAFDKLYQDELRSDVSIEDEEYEEDKYSDEVVEFEEEGYDENSDTNTTSGCSMKYDPVCGTDGLNYANECEAKDNDVEVAYKGECREEEDPKYNNEDVEFQEEEAQEGREEDVQGAQTSRPVWLRWWPF